MQDKLDSYHMNQYSPFDWHHKICLCKAIKEVTSKKNFFHAKWWSKFDLQLYPKGNMKTKILTAQGKMGRGKYFAGVKPKTLTAWISWKMSNINSSFWYYMLKWLVLVPFLIIVWKVFLWTSEILIRLNNLILWRF